MILWNLPCWKLPVSVFNHATKSLKRHISFGSVSWKTFNTNKVDILVGEHWGYISNFICLGWQKKNTFSSQLLLHQHDQNLPRCCGQNKVLVLKITLIWIFGRQQHLLWRAGVMAVDAQLCILAGPGPNTSSRAPGHWRRDGEIKRKKGRC